VELPKGSYAAAFHERANAASAHGNGSAAGTWANDSVEKFIGVGEEAVPGAGDELLVDCGAGDDWVALVDAAGVGCIRGQRCRGISASAPIRIFWKGFVRGPEEPWVIFSNAAFVGRPNTGMRYYDAAKDAKSPILDHYTGVGEVLAVHSLDIVFGELHQALRVKRGSLFSLDDAKNNDLISWDRRRKT